jgi:hypothetical protein
MVIFSQVEVAVVMSMISIRAHQKARRARPRTIRHRWRSVIGLDDAATS